MTREEKALLIVILRMIEQLILRREADAHPDLWSDLEELGSLISQLQDMTREGE